MPSSDASPEKTKSKDVILTENTDDFIIGDRVWVNGTKPGYIQYLGETRFSPGDWAGVVLDDCTGKNDGSVSGFRYFQCEPKRGVFARLYKLTRFPLTPSKSSDSEGTRSPLNGSGSLSPNRGTPPPSLRCSTPTRAASPGALLSPSLKPRVGDRVVVNATNGSKTGYLRYLGTTAFAPGEWAGVELDEPLGKNDGTVAGKKYFDCTMKYGLFAPAHKVTKATGSAAHRRQGSHESLSSSLSSGTGRNTRSILTSTGLTASSALQDAVREKENHIEQLLKERDLERAEVIRVAAQVDEVEQQLANLQKEHRKYVDESEKRTSRLRQLLEGAETERRRLNRQLEEERKKVEDLQFRVEEESISKDDLEVQTEQEKRRIEELERKLDEEKRSNKMFSEGNNMHDVIEDAIKRYKEEAETLRQKLKTAEIRIKTLEKNQEQRSSAVRSQLQGDLTKKEESLLQMQVTLENKKRELSSLQSRIAEMEKELDKYRVRQEKHLETIDGLNLKLQKSEYLASSLSEDLHTIKVNLADTERRLEASDEKCQELTKQREKLQDQLETIQDSKSTNESSITLTHELREKERLVEDLETRLRLANQDIAKIKDTEKGLRQQHQVELRAVASRHEEEMNALKEKLDTTKQELGSKEDRVLSLSQAVNRLESKLSDREEEIARLKSSLDLKDAQLSRHEARLQEADLKMEALQHLSTLQDKLSRTQAENDLLKVEKEEAVKRWRVAEESKQRLSDQRDQWTKERLDIFTAMEERENQVTILKREVDRLRSEFSVHREDLVKKLAETEFDTKAMEELQMQIESQRRVLEDMQKRLHYTENERDGLHQELLSAKAFQTDNSELEAKTSALKQELDHVKKRCDELLKEQESLQRTLEATQIVLDQREQQISVYQQELSAFRLSQDQRHEDPEKRKLENKIVELQVALARLQKTINIPDSEYQKVKEEKEALENQVDFMNSVIVDMQKKNDDLKGRLEILETEVIFDGQVNLTGIPQRATSRLFCDICDVFDLHDTEDCPRQSSENRGKFENRATASCEESEMF